MTALHHMNWGMVVYYCKKKNCNINVMITDIEKLQCCKDISVVSSVNYR